MIERFIAYADVKNSGAECFGYVPAHWACVPLFAVASPKSVSNCPDRELLSVYLNRGVVRFSEIAEKRTNTTSSDLSKYQAVEPGDFVLNNQQAWRGSVGVSQHSGIVAPPIWFFRWHCLFILSTRTTFLETRQWLANTSCVQKGLARFKGIYIGLTSRE